MLRFVAVVSGLSIVKNSDVSSANTSGPQVRLSDKWFEQMLNRSGTRIEPWDIIALILGKYEHWPLRTDFPLQEASREP